MKLFTKVFAMSALLGLAACGGGGDEPAATATPLSVANYGDVAAEAVGSLGDGDILGAIAFPAQATSSAASWTDLASGDASSISRLMLNQLTKGSSVKARIASVSQYSEPCIGGGSLDLTENDADNNAELSAGDTASITARNCVVQAGVPAVNGQLSIRINSVQLDQFGEIVAGAFTLSISNFQSGSVQLNGLVDAALNPQSFVLQFRQLTAVDGTERRTLDFTLNESLADGSLSASGNLVINDSSYLLSTPVTLRPGSQYFSSGTLRVADRSGGYADMVMSVPSYTVNLYLPGDLVVDASKTVLWSSL